MTAPPLCRALSGHAWIVEPPIVVVKKGRRITLRCTRCESRRFDVWNPLNGSVVGRRYDQDDDYHAYLADHSQADTRAELVGFYGRSHATKRTHLRSLSKTEKVAQLRHHNAHALERTRRAKRRRAGRLPAAR